MDFCVSFGLTQCVHSPTREKNTLDLILTNAEDIINSVQIMPSPVRSDHMAVYFNVLFDRHSDVVVKRTFQWSKGQYDMIDNELCATDWLSLFTGCQSANEMYIRLHAVISDLVNLFVPFLAKKPPTHRLSAHIKALNKKLADLKDSPAEALKVQKALTRATRRERVLTESSLNINNAKQFFNYVNSRLKSRTTIGPLTMDNAIVTDDDQVAETFRSHFSSVFSASGRHLRPQPMMTSLFSMMSLSLPKLCISSYGR